LPAANAIFAGTILTSTQAGIGMKQHPTDSWIAVTLNVTDVSGTDPQAVFYIQWSLDGAVWADAEPRDEFNPITAPCTVTKRFDVKAQYWRACVDITGTNPSFTGSANAYS
jgi:hypothetical protein